MTTVYRFYDVADELLYVGASARIPDRLAAHANAQPRWEDVVRVELTHGFSPRDASIAELDAIRTERPRWNVVGIPRAVVDEQKQQWGRNVEARRRDLEYSQRSLAEELSRALGEPVTQQAISLWEIGVCAPRDRYRSALAQVLRLDVYDLFPLPVTEAVA